MPLDPVPTDFSTPAPIYQDDRGELWEVIGYITHPATCLRNIKTGERHVEIIGCKNAERFTRLDRYKGGQEPLAQPSTPAAAGNADHLSYGNRQYRDTILDLLAKCSTCAATRILALAAKQVAEQASTEWDRLDMMRRNEVKDSFTAGKNSATFEKWVMPGPDRPSLSIDGS